MWINILLVGLGSMAGGVSRYLISEGMKQWLPTIFPLGTYAVNMAGCFLIGILAGLPSSPGVHFTEQHKLLLAIGFCGSFTTFSTFSMENLQLLSSKMYVAAALNIFLSIAGGLLAVAAGYHLSRQ